MKYLIWKAIHRHSKTFSVRRGRIAYCDACDNSFNLK